MRFAARITQLEQQLTAAVRQTWRQARPQLLDALSRGLHTAQPIIADVGRQLASQGTLMARNAEATSLVYAQGQAARLEGPVAILGADSAALTPLRSGLPAWQAATLGRFLMDGQRLAAATMEPPAIAAELTAVDAVGGRISAWRWADGALELAVEAALWQAVNGTLGTAYGTIARTSRRQYQKQALAAIDGRTTRCCLNVHGQIQDLDRPFVLSGTPRFADAMQQPPFHHRCRTVIALYLPEMEQIGPTTESLRSAARAQLRQAPGRRTH